MGAALNCATHRADRGEVVDAGVAGVPTHASWPRLALRGVGWAAYCVAIVDAIAAVLIDPHGNTWTFPSARVAVAATAVAAIAAASHLTRGMPCRTRWAHPVVFRVAALAALIATASYGGWEAKQADAEFLRQSLANYTSDAQHVRSGMQSVDLALSASALIPYTDAPCQPTASTGTRCWTGTLSPGPLGEVLRAALSGPGAEHFASSCTTTTDSCHLSGNFAGVEVRMILQRVTMASCHCPTAALQKANTLVTIYVLPATLFRK